MKRVYQVSEVLASGKEVFAGIDVHKATFHMTAISDGEEVFNGGMPSQYTVLRKLLDRFKDCRVRVAYEAGPSGFWLYDNLTADGFEAIVVPPSLIPVESGNKVKTDKRDSRKLARLLEGGLLKKVHILSEQVRADRELLRTRRQIVNHRADVAKQIKSKLLFWGIAIPFSDRRYWSKEYREWIKGLEVEYESLRASFGYLIELYEYLSEQIKGITQEVGRLSDTERYRERVNLLRTVPGLGTLTAIEILVELGEMKRFKTSKELSSFLGLTPSEYSTGERIRHGKITRCGNKRVRTALVEASWKTIAKDPVMREKYERIKYRRGAKRAIVAVARILSGKIRRVLLDKKLYELGKRRVSIKVSA